MPIRIGTAGWSLTAEMKAELPEVGTHLERYASRFDGVEINSSFYRPHRRSTYERWAESVPKTFRFAVKVPKVITHERRLRNCDREIGRFLEESSGLGANLGPYLVQLPPSLDFDPPSCQSFFELFRQGTIAKVVIEPRHASWFMADADECLSELQISRVAADPALLPIAAEPGGYRQFAYFRLHGSPQMYYSNYSDEELQAWLQIIQARNSGECWCIFDNTAAGAAFQNATTLQHLARQIASKAT